MKLRRNYLRREDGVAMTEFALVLPVFMLIVVGLLGFGRVFFYWISANHLANETARWAAVDRRPDPTKTLQEYASGDRRSDVDANQMMRNVAALLLEDEIRALASYVQGLN